MGTEIELKKKDKFWSSNLGIFILSVIFLTLIPFFYTNIQQFISQRKLDSQLKTKFLSEISHRLNTIKLITIKNTRPYQFRDIRLATFGMKESLKPDYYSFNSIYKEFENITLLSLMYQLNNITRLDKRKKSNQHLIKAIGNIKPAIDELVLNPKYRRKVIINENNWTYEYTPNDSLNIKLNELLISEIEVWKMNWE
jgi:hypothetical protein